MVVGCSNALFEFEQLSLEDGVQNIFNKKSWFEDLKNQNNKEFVGILKRYKNEFKESLLYSLSNNELSKKWDSRIVLLNELYTKCSAGGDTAVLISVLEDSQIAGVLPPAFVTRGKTHKTLDLLKTSVESVALVEREWDTVLQKAQETGLYKISKKISKLAWSLYCVQFSKKLFICTKEDVVGIGTRKIFSSFPPLLGSYSLGIAKGVKYNETIGREYTEDQWKKEIDFAFSQDSTISKALLDLKVPHIPEIMTVRDGEKIRNVMMESWGVLGDLLDSPDHFEEKLMMFFQLLESLEGMHDNNLCHLDLGPKNINVIQVGSEYEAQLSDFGTTRERGQIIKGIVSTYPSPKNFEAYLQSQDYKVNPSDDLWVLGSILCQIKYGTSPLLKYRLFPDANLIREEECNFWEQEYLLELEKQDATEDQKRVASEQLEKVRGARENLSQNRLLYSQRLEDLQQFLKENFSKSNDTYDQCIVRLLSVDPKLRPSVKEVKEILLAWVETI